MDKDAHRLARLRILVIDAGGPAAFVRAYSQPAADKPIDPTYVSQLLNGKRVFGEKAAKNMERRAGLPEGYFDEGWAPPKANSANQDVAHYPFVPAPQSQREKDISEITKLARILDPTGLGMLLQEARSLAKYRRLTTPKTASSST